jgi:glycosyltransferase involved in cell wall biosynthesis
MPEPAETEGLAPAPTLRASVCVPTYNRHDLVLQTLDALQRQSMPPDRYEVVVVVDGSSDKTAEALAQLQLRCPFRWVWQENQGLSAARNAGARLAQHDVLIFLDDDLLATPGLVGAHLDAQARHRDVLVQGFYPVAPGHLRTGASLFYDQVFRESLESLQAPNAPSRWPIWGGNISVRRDTFTRLGGFDQQTFREYGGEDTDFGLRLAGLGIPFVFEPRALAHHLHQVGYPAYRRQAFHEGRSLQLLARKHGVPVNTFTGNSVERPLDQAVGKGWLRSPGAMDALGRTLTAGLWGADHTQIRPLQMFMARLVNRYYKVGGLALEGRPG